jgi:hypothetical protein
VVLLQYAAHCANIFVCCITPRRVLDLHFLYVQLGRTSCNACYASIHAKSPQSGNYHACGLLVLQGEFNALRDQLMLLAVVISIQEMLLPYAL